MWRATTSAGCTHGSACTGRIEGFPLDGLPASRVTWDTMMHPTTYRFAFVFTAFLREEAGHRRMR